MNNKILEAALDAQSNSLDEAGAQSPHHKHGSFTAGTTPERIIKKALPHKYKMELNKSDMMVLLHALKESSGMAAMDLRMSILDTIGIEEM